MSNLQFDDSLEHLRPALAALVNRLAQGEREYQGRSLARPPEDLVRELQLEVIDLAGWGLLLWMRIEALRRRLGEWPLDEMPELRSDS